MKQGFFMIISLLIAGNAWTQDSTKISTAGYKPEIHGTVRGKYEYEHDIKSGRFQIRNTRFSITGKVYPTVDYKAEIDLSDEGKIKMLDAYTRLSPINDFNFTIGQMRVPFTIDAHRSPHQQYFANRSFIAKQVGNVRDVGLTLGYKLKTGFPIILEGGVYNGSGLTEQKEWHKSMSYSAKAQFLFVKGLNLTLSLQSIEPNEIVRMNLYDAGIYYEFNNFHIEGEYLFKKYSDDLFKDVHSLNTFICYDRKLKKVFSKISYLLRYDMMTDHNNGYINESTYNLDITDYQRQRLTGGLTLSITKSFISDIRINYEKYFYNASGIPKESEQDKIVIEFMTRF